MEYARLPIIALLLCQIVAAAAMAGERARSQPAPAAIGPKQSASRPLTKDMRAASDASLDRVAIAVDGAESSHGQDGAMWRPDPAAPQGPMQVSEAAAVDAGGGDRFDLAQNRAIGRAYLAQLFSRYRNWPDAIAAYNWGIGKMDAWVKAGRPPDKFLAEVAVYLRRVLHESGLCDGSATNEYRRADGKLLAKRSVQVSREPGASPPDELVYAACSAEEGWTGTQRVAMGSSRFFSKLDEAMRLAVLRAAGSR
jgi:Transglycosylase SLT domain